MLLSYKQIEGNLRRTAQKGYISLLDHYQLEALALKYFGVKDEDGEIIGYTCPYSGNLITDFSDIVLEHIISVSSKGGTVLFNCIPTSSEVNKTSEKGTKPLIDWWTNSKYWDEEAPLRLEKLVNYMLEAYENVFKEYTIEEVENSYLDIELYEEERETTADLEYSSKKELELLNEQSNNKVQTYLGTILNFIETLEKHNINTTEIKNKLKQLENNHIFEDIERYQLFQNIIQQLIISKIGEDNRSYLTYTLNIDKKKLMDSINSNNPEYIFNEINNRLTYIENLLKQNNLSIVEYFKSVGEITDIDIIYNSIDKITKEQLDIFLENIKLGIDSKIEIFINMLNKGNSKILKARNKEILEGYPNINLSHFWILHKEKVIKKLFDELKHNSEYDIARRIVDINEITINVEKQIIIFINMLNKGNSKILKQRNKETLEGYPNIKLGRFWTSHKEKIIKKLFDELGDNKAYDIARRLVDINEMTINVEKQIPIFINMLNIGNSEILKHGNKETLEGYPNIKLSQFWSNHKEKIIQKLFDELKENRKYEKARKIVDINEMTINVEKQIPIFITMLNKGNVEILKYGNEETLEGYPNIKLARFWQTNKPKIIQKLYVELKDNTEYDNARKILDKYKIENNIDSKIDIFINMLNKGNGKILKYSNDETLEGYPNIKLSQFWSNHKERIIQKLFNELKDNKKYDNARKLINVFEAENNMDKRIETFIEMLNKGNSDVLKKGNKETLKGYSNIKLSNFWRNNKEKIIQKLFDELKDNTEYDNARRLVDINEMTINVEKQIPIFINMLNIGNSEILKQGNKEVLEGYPNIKLACFWNSHKERIVKKLFIELKDNKKYDSARRIVDKFMVENNVAKQIPIFINMLNKGNIKILKKRNEETLEGYSNIKLAYFWGNNKERIIPKLFYDLKDNPEYNIARQTVLTYLKVSTIEEYQEKLKKQQELKELKTMKKDLEVIEDTIELESNEHRKRA